jgi:hypothetical protein
MNDQKKLFRSLKRIIKKTGNRRTRNALKRSLSANPAEAHWDEIDYGKSSSTWLNGIDEDGIKSEKYT